MALFGKIRTFFFSVVLENLTLSSATFTDRWANGPEEKSASKDDLECLEENRDGLGSKLPPLGAKMCRDFWDSYSERAFFLFFCFVFISSDCVYCTWTFLKMASRSGRRSSHPAGSVLDKTWRLHTVEMRAGVWGELPGLLSWLCLGFSFFFCFFFLAMIWIEKCRFVARWMWQGMLLIFQKMSSVFTPPLQQNPSHALLNDLDFKLFIVPWTSWRAHCRRTYGDRNEGKTLDVLFWMNAV